MKEKEEVLKKLWLACIYNLACERLLQIFTGEIEAKPGREELGILQRFQDIPVVDILGGNLEEEMSQTKINLQTIKVIGQGYEDWQNFEDFCGEVK